MRKATTLYYLLCSIVFLCYPRLLQAQTLSPHWAKQVYSTNKGYNATGKRMATDKHGNVYWLSSPNRGKIVTDGQSTPDSTATAVLVSWDCNGSFRWMKVLGSGAISGQNIGCYLVTDTLEGIYISGYALSNQTAATSIYWDGDTSINIAAGTQIAYLAKYNSQGQFQWLRTPVSSQNLNVGAHILLNGLSVSASGQLFWFTLLDTGSYGGGTFSITNRGYYAVNYDASGNYQAATLMDMTPPSSNNKAHQVLFKFDPVANRFYGWLRYDTLYGGNLTIGNNTLIPPTGTNKGRAVLAAFNRQGNNIWVRQASIATNSDIGEVAFGQQGSLYLTGTGDTGTVFCGDTIKNAFSQRAVYLMALDTNAALLWATHPDNNYSVEAGSINVMNNTLISSGRYMGTLNWGGQSITSPVSMYTNGYMLRANATTGNVSELKDIDVINTSWLSLAVALDKNDNAYVNGVFGGWFYFANDTFSSPYSTDILLKYKNVVCGCDLLQPSFSANAIGTLTYQYTYTGGTPFTSISWDFGDGSLASSATNPSHTYTTQGTYPICVTVTNGCGSNTTCKYMVIEATNVGTINSYSDIIIYPNPAHDKLIIRNLPQGTIVEMLDVMGRTLIRKEAGSGEINLEVKSLSPGVYLLHFMDSIGGKSSRVFVKE